MKNTLNLLLRRTEYKSLYRSIFYTLMIMVVYIIGSNIEILSTANGNKNLDAFSNIGVAAMGGNFTAVTLFSLGLGPYLTAMLIVNLLAIRNPEKMMMQTKKERQFKEKAFTMILATVQAYYLLNMYVKNGDNRIHIMAMGMLVLIAGSMLLIWLADQNTMYGIAGPMPIVVMSIIKSIMHSNAQNDIHLKIIVWIAIACILLFCAVLLIIIERAEYRIDYRDILNNSKDKQSFIAWKLNPGGSLAIMVSMSLFMIIKAIIELCIILITQKQELTWLDFKHPLGITIYMILLFSLAYILSLLMLNPKRKTTDFLKSGNYIEGVHPGKQTESYLTRKARKISLFSGVMIVIIIGLPFYFTLIIPVLSKEIYLAIQILMLIYISINITDVIKNKMYFNRYKNFMNKYW